MCNDMVGINYNTIYIINHLSVKVLWRVLQKIVIGWGDYNM